MSTIDRDLLANVKAQLRKRAFVPAGMLGQEDPAAAGPQEMAMGPGQGGPPGPPTGGPPTDPSAGGGMPPGMPGDPTQATGGAAGGMDPNMPGGGPGPQDPNAPVGPAGQKGKNSGKINDITYLATEVGEIKGRMNLMLELMQGQLAPTKSASKKVAVDEQAMWTLIEMLKMD